MYFNISFAVTKLLAVCTLIVNPNVERKFTLGLILGQSSPFRILTTSFLQDPLSIFPSRSLLFLSLLNDSFPTECVNGVEWENDCE